MVRPELVKKTPSLLTSKESASAIVEISVAALTSIPRAAICVGIGHEISVLLRAIPGTTTPPIMQVNRDELTKLTPTAVMSVPGPVTSPVVMEAGCTDWSTGGEPAGICKAGV